MAVLLIFYIQNDKGRPEEPPRPSQPGPVDAGNPATIDHENGGAGWRLPCVYISLLTSDTAPDTKASQMAKWQKLLDKMRNNPRSDWTIENIETVAGNIEGMAVLAPAHGSHYKVSHPDQDGILTIPAKRPLKPVYIKAFVSMIDSITE